MTPEWLTNGRILVGALLLAGLVVTLIVIGAGRVSAHLRRADEDLD